MAKHDKHEDARHKDEAPQKDEGPPASPRGTPAPRFSRNKAGRPAGLPRLAPPEDEGRDIPGIDLAGDEMLRPRKAAGGTPAPPVVWKVVAAIDESPYSRHQIEDVLRPASWTRGMVNRWLYISGEPTMKQLLGVSRYLDVSIEYLMDDEVGIIQPHPRRDDDTMRKLGARLDEMGLSPERALDCLHQVRANGLGLDHVIEYLMVIAAAVELDLSPGQMLRNILSMSKQRDTFLDEDRRSRQAPGAPVPMRRDGFADEDRRPRPAPAPANVTVVMDAPTVEQRDRDRWTAAIEAEKRRGGPKPRTG